MHIFSCDFRNRSFTDDVTDEIFFKNFLFIKNQFKSRNIHGFFLQRTDYSNQSGYLFTPEMKMKYFD